MTEHQRCRMQLRVVLRQFGFLEPSIMIISNTYPPVTFLDSTRINVLSKELTGSLRDGLLLERRVKSSTFKVVKRTRIYIAHGIQKLP